LGSNCTVFENLGYTGTYYFNEELSVSLRLATGKRCQKPTDPEHFRNVDVVPVVSGTGSGVTMKKNNKHF
jgi:hypothetical protein